MTFGKCLIFSQIMKYYFIICEKIKQIPIETKSANMSNIVTCNNLLADFVPIFDK